jgi:hypothetical protein
MKAVIVVTVVSCTGKPQAAADFYAQHVLVVALRRSSIGPLMHALDLLRRLLVCQILIPSL